MRDDATSPAPAPWWKFGYVWLVIAGPCAVVVAGFVTAWLAMSSPDPVLANAPDRRGAGIAQVPARDPAMLPALQGRNHAATGAPAR